MPYSKRSAEGYRERIAHLVKIFDGKIPQAAMTAYPRAKVAKDDVLDASAILVSVSSMAAGRGRRLPEPSERDSDGIDMAIWF